MATSFVRTICTAFMATVVLVVGACRGDEPDNKPAPEPIAAAKVTAALPELCDPVQGSPRTDGGKYETEC